MTEDGNAIHDELKTDPVLVRLLAKLERSQAGLFGLLIDVFAVDF